MKRLLLPLLTTIALPTFAGDLGEADYKYDPKRSINKVERTKLLKNGGTYSIRCGRRRKICKIQFKDGKLTVNGSRGITPDQIISFDYNFYSFNIFYKDSNEIINFAIFDWKGMGITDAFKTEFLLFMNQGKNLPDNYF